MEQKFKTGDLVQLKSGGPCMTVRGYEPADSNEVVCEWFDGNVRHEKAFNQDMLNNYAAYSPIISGRTQNPNLY